MEGGKAGEGKRFVLVSTIPGVEMMKGARTKSDGAASLGLDGGAARGG